MLLTVFTPVYNRAELIRRAYQSLLRQTDKDFEWVVVNDGSTDGGATDAALADIVANHDGSFPIVVERQENGGKHRAVNRGVRMARAPWFIILDSDDILADDAVATIRRRTDEIKDRPDMMGFVGLRVTPDGRDPSEKLSGKSPRRRLDCDYLDTTMNHYRFELKIEGDRAEVIRTDIMRLFPFPEIEGEKFISEVIWMLMGREYKARFTNDPIYICEYQPDGLSARIRKLLNDNPVGATISAAMTLDYCALSSRDRLLYVCRWLKRRRRAIELGRTLPPEADLPRKARKWLIPAKMIMLGAKVLGRK